MKANWTRSGRCAAMLLLFAVMQAAAAEPKRILLLHSFGPDFPPFAKMAEAFGAEIVKRSPQPINLYEASIYSARLQAPTDETALREYLRDLFSEHRPHLIVTFGEPAHRFVQRHREQLFPATPVIITGIATRRVHASLLTANDAVLASTVDLDAIIRNILRLLPDVKHVAVAIGDSPLERFWVAEMQREFKPYEGRVAFIWLNDSPLEEMLARIRALPPRSALFYFKLVVDAGGITYPRDRAFAPIHSAAPVPVFGYGDYHLGQGIVGGPLIPVLALSREAADTAIRILAGEPPAAFRPQPLGMTTPAYDWRELRRWSISENLLPEGATVLYRAPTLWSQYRGYVVGALALIVLQGLLIGSLILQRSRRARIESALRESESRFRATADSVPVMIWMAGPDQLRDYCNKSWLDYTGRSEAQERGSGWTENVHPHDRQRYLTAYQGAFDLRQPFEIEYRLRRHDGEYRWMLSRGVPRYAASGAFLGFTGSSLDITDRKRVEEGIQQLAHVSRLAVLGELTASIAHEINQPLGAIRSNADAAEMLLRCGSDRLEEVREILDDIRRDDARASEVVRRIRDLLQKHEPVIEAYDLNEVVRDCVRMVGGDAARRQVTIETNLTALPMLQGDRFRTQQVLLNLLLNAMDAMASTPRERRLISIRTSGHGHGTAEVAVADCGTGIAPNELPRIFDSFYTTKKDGMGLGLAIARFMIEAQSGRIWAENNAAGGAVFHCELPLSALPTST